MPVTPSPLPLSSRRPSLSFGGFGLNETVEDSQTVSVEPGETVAFEFAVELDAGDYNVRIERLLGGFVVGLEPTAEPTPEPEPEPSEGAGGVVFIIVGVVVVIAIIAIAVFIYRRR